MSWVWLASREAVMTGVRRGVFGAVDGGRRGARTNRCSSCVTEGAAPLLTSAACTVDGGRRGARTNRCSSCVTEGAAPLLTSAACTAAARRPTALNGGTRPNPSRSAAVGSVGADEAEVEAESTEAAAGGTLRSEMVVVVVVVVVAG
jgi:hypothetical protein